MNSILHIMQCANLGGMEQTTVCRIRGLIDHGQNCRLVSLHPIGRLGDVLRRKSIPSKGLRYRGLAGIRSIPEMHREFRREPCDAVMMTGHNLAAMVALGDIGKGHRILCIHFHHEGVKPRWQWRLIYRMALSKFDAITFPSDFVRREAEAIEPGLRAKSHTLRNAFEVPAIPTMEEKKAARERLGVPAGVPTVSNAGWLIARKRFDVFLRVAAVVRKSFPTATFVIAGDGPERPRLEALANSLGLGQSVKWLGWQEDVSTLYKASDVLLFNSDWDALGRTPIEAILLGTPAVVSQVHGGLWEVLEPDAHVFMRRDHDIDWLSARVEELLRNPVDSRSMVHRARVHLQSSASVERDVSELFRLMRIQ